MPHSFPTAASPQESARYGLRAPGCTPPAPIEGVSGDGPRLAAVSSGCYGTTIIHGAHWSLTAIHGRQWQVAATIATIPCCMRGRCRAHCCALLVTLVLFIFCAEFRRMASTPCWPGLPSCIVILTSSKQYPSPQSFLGNLITFLLDWAVGPSAWPECDAPWRERHLGAPPCRCCMSPAAEAQGMVPE